MVSSSMGGGTGRRLAYPPRAARIPRCDRSQTMLIGAHVSPAGGPANAVARGVERGCDAIQIFNQNPRAWKPTVYSDEQVADFREAMASSRVDALLIHAVYLLNAATTDKEMRDKTRASLIASLRAGRRARRPRRRPAPRQRAGRQGRPGDQARGQGHRAGAGRERDTARCTWRTPPAPAARSGARSRSSPTSSTPPAARTRLGLCLDSCHLFASGYDIRTEEGLTQVLDECADVGRPGSPRLAAPQRLPDAAGLQPRPPRRRRRGRARPPRMRGLPVRAALRRTAVRAGDAGTRPPRPDAGRRSP